MAPFEKTIAYPETAQVPAADYTFDLPNEPVSFLDFRFVGICDVDVLVALTPEAILLNIDRIDIRYNGADVVSLTGYELLIYGLCTQGCVPVLTYDDQTAAAVFTLDVRLPFSRIAYDPKECYPATPKGNSQARIQVIAVFNVVTSFTLEVTACRLPGATPPKFLALDRIITAGLPIGFTDTYLTVAYPYVGLLIWADTIRTGITNTSVLDRLSLFEDSDEVRLHRISFTELRQGFMEKMRNYNWARQHAHKTPVTPAVIGGPTTEQHFVDDQKYQHYCYQDFDPLLDGSHILNVSRDHELIARTEASVGGAISFFPIILRPATGLAR